VCVLEEGDWLCVCVLFFHVAPGSIHSPRSVLSNLVTPGGVGSYTHTHAKKERERERARRCTHKMEMCINIQGSPPRTPPQNRRPFQHVFLFSFRIISHHFIFWLGKNWEKREKKFWLFSLDSLLTDWRLFDLIRLQTSSSPIYTQEHEKGPSLLRSLGAHATINK
jgi:hypothetical protein